MLKLLIFAGLLFVVSPALGQPEYKYLLCDGDQQTSVQAPLLDTQVWCAILAQRRGTASMNIAATNATSGPAYHGHTNNILFRVQQGLTYQPSCVAIMAPINEAGILPAQTKANLISAINQYKAAGVGVTLFNAFPWWSGPSHASYPPYARAIREAAIAANVPFISAYYTSNIDRCIYEPPGTPQEAVCYAAYVASQYDRPNATSHLAIADLCKVPANASACACIKP